MCGRLQQFLTLENGLLFFDCNPYLRKEQRNVSKYFLLSLHNENRILLLKCRNVGYVIHFEKTILNI